MIAKLRHLGDVLLITPFIQSIKALFPDCAIDVYIYKECLPLLEGHPAIRSFLFAEKGLSNEISLLRTIRKNRYDGVFNLTEGDRGALACLVSGATYRVGFDPGKSGFFLKKKAYSHIVEHCPNPKHTVEKNLDALRVLGLSPPENVRNLYLHIPEDAKTDTSNYILFHPVSRWLFKCIPHEASAQLINHLQKRGETVVITSGPQTDELRYIDAMLEHVEGNVENLAGKTSVKELGGLIQNSDLLVCPDSVPFHMANALKHPVVSYFGPSSEKNWGPWRNPNARIVAQKLPCRPCFRAGCANSKISDCLTTLKVDQILDAIYSLKSLPKYASCAISDASSSALVPERKTDPSFIK